MTADWRISRLGEVCEFSRGLTYSKGDEVEKSSNVVLRANNINLATNRLDFSELKFINDRVKVPNTKKVKRGAILICTASGSKSHLGKVAYIDTKDDYAFGGFMGMLTPNPEMFSRFLFYLMITPEYKDFIEQLTDGLNINNLKWDDLQNFEIPLPPLDEQKRIVAILDEAFAGIDKAIANTERNLANAKELFESYLNSVFANPGEDWEERRLADLCVKDRVITYGVIKLGEEKPNGVPCLRTSNVRWLKIDTTGLKRIGADLSASYSRTILKGGEILVNVRGTLGGVAVVPPEMRNWNVSREVAVVPIDPLKINPTYLCYLIGCQESQKRLGEVEKGATYVGVNLEDLRLLPITAPSLDEQAKTVNQIQVIQGEAVRLEATYKQKLADLAELKQSILQKAFTGELTAEPERLLAEVGV